MRTTSFYIASRERYKSCKDFNWISRYKKILPIDYGGLALIITMFLAPISIFPQIYMKFFCVFVFLIFNIVHIFAGIRTFNSKIEIDKDKLFIRYKKTKKLLTSKIYRIESHQTGEQNFKIIFKGSLIDPSWLILFTDKLPKELQQYKTE